MFCISSEPLICACTFLICLALVVGDVPWTLRNGTFFCFVLESIFDLYSFVSSCATEYWNVTPRFGNNGGDVVSPEFRHEEYCCFSRADWAVCLDEGLERIIVDHFGDFHTTLLSSSLCRVTLCQIRHWCDSFANRQRWRRFKRLFDGDGLLHNALLLWVSGLLLWRKVLWGLWHIFRACWSHCHYMFVSIEGVQEGIRLAYAGGHWPPRFCETHFVLCFVRSIHFSGWCGEWPVDRGSFYRLFVISLLRE